VDSRNGRGENAYRKVRVDKMSCDESSAKDELLKGLEGDLRQYTPDNPLFLKSGVSPLENNRECIELLRFLLDDDAFSPDFLITAIFAYHQWELNSKGGKGIK